MPEAIDNLRDFALRATVALRGMTLGGAALSAAELRDLLGGARYLEALVADGEVLTGDLGTDPEGAPAAPRSCSVCGCTDLCCAGCIARTGEACTWAWPDLCSACVDV